MILLVGFKKLIEIKTVIFGQYRKTENWIALRKQKQGVPRVCFTIKGVAVNVLRDETACVPNIETITSVSTMMGKCILQGSIQFLTASRIIVTPLINRLLTDVLTLLSFPVTEATFCHGYWQYWPATLFLGHYVKPVWLCGGVTVLSLLTSK